MNNTETYQPIIESLLSLGVGQFDSDVYTTIFQKGTISISTLAKTLSVERPTIYASLIRLEKLGLTPSGRNPYSRLITVEPPSRIATLLEQQKTLLDQRKTRLNHILPDLLASYAEKSLASAFRLFEGKQQFLTIFEESLDEAKDEILFFGNATEFIKFEGLEYEKRWIKKRVKKNISIRVLSQKPLEEINDIQQIESSNKKELRTVRYLPQTLKLKSSYMVYGYKTVLWNPVAERAIVLDDPSITKMFKLIFDLAWKGAER